MLDASKKVLELYDRDEFAILVVQGKNGYGKSTYCNRIIAEVYGVGNNTPDSIKARQRWNGDGIHGNWNTALFRQHLGFHPQLVINKWYKMKKRDYCYHWDDAGVWLSNYDYNDPFVKDVGKYLQTARDDWGAIIFSCIDKGDVFKKLRDFKSCIIVDITKEGAWENAPSEYTHKRFVRTARAYHYWEDRKGRLGTENDWAERYNCHVPNSFHSWYRPLRRKYSKMAKKLMREKAMKKMEFTETKKMSKL